MSYPNQFPPLTKEELETFLTNTGSATLCTHNRDGSIHATPVGYFYNDGKIEIISHASTRKNRNIKRNNQVTLLIDTKKPFRGALIYGEASISRDNVLPMIRKMFEHMTPADKLEAVSREYL
ncbi:MAG: pyridoxamine 5'-phosphate oxidase family protein, partial [Candidatus Bathyarchaeota archaeon]|nr:pyridoxamine 5'-phosphate oxidase family protein [Candidatus Bathyarchaeota archaeon]